MRLYLVRHPQPLIASGICYGASDVLCSAEQLEIGAQDLLKELPKDLRMISSPLQRCERLAQVLCRLQPDLSYKTDEKLAEMHFGAWEMQAWDAIAPEELKAWTDDFAAYRCGGSGESAGQFVQRVAQRLLESAQHEESEIWITHAGVIRALQWLQTLSFEAFTALVQHPAPLCEPLSQLRAADWPKGVVAWCRVQHWDWPSDWPQDWPKLR
jgi:alpha-ribazole phosphatase